MLTKHEKIQGCCLPGGVIPQTNTACICSIVFHGHFFDDDTDVPFVYITAKLYTVFIALTILYKSIKIPIDSIILVRKENVQP